MEKKKIRKTVKWQNNELFHDGIVPENFQYIFHNFSNYFSDSSGL